ncbi:IPT/TIG domain-containing protein [Methanospirillum lacunae]|uniref:IPT/TIG domain-containing protein n=1 Tax=Methanospirillum lacunae TaxID=668570 RepID=A0A2V2ND78_9EURY|nr:IPT/TIG domain-containing protein [Methanospirillum lacunae]PWR74368.1 hypothetical protein DK846_04250 [Methanospirillum lacunae]
MNLKFLIIGIMITSCIICTAASAAVQTNQSKTDNVGTVSGFSDVTVSSINPTTGKAGEQVSFNLTGSGFANGIRIYLEDQNAKSNKIMSAQLIDVVSPTLVTGVFNVPKSATPGNWLIITKKDSQVTNSNVNFTVTN